MIRPADPRPRALFASRRSPVRARLAPYAISCNQGTSSHHPLTSEVGWKRFEAFHPQSVRGDVRGGAAGLMFLAREKRRGPGRSPTLCRRRNHSYRDDFDCGSRRQDAPGSRPRASRKARRAALRSVLPGCRAELVPRLRLSFPFRALQPAPTRRGCREHFAEERESKQAHHRREERYDHQRAEHDKTDARH